MLSRFSEETTVHGIKDAWRGNRISRIFWLIVFILFATTMILQLKGVFGSYIRGSVGTTVASTAKSRYLEVPSFYYCNMRWLPNVQPMQEVLAFDGDVRYNERKCRGLDQQDRIAIMSRVIPIGINPRGYDVSKDHCPAYRDLWRSSMRQQFVADIIMPKDPTVFRFSDKPGDFLRRYIDYMVDERDMLKEFMEEVNNEHGGSLTKYVETLTTVLDRNGTHARANGVCIEARGFMHYHNEFKERKLDENEYPARRNFTDSAFVEQFKYEKRVYKKTKPWPQWLHPRSGSISLSLNGMCWEVKPGPKHQKSVEAAGRKYQHVVVHFGGFGYQLKQIAMERGLKEAMEYATYDPTDEKYNSADDTDKKYEMSKFTTFASIASQNQAVLHFPEQIRLDGMRKCVRIRYSTTKRIYLKRKSWPCREGTWTQLDQAHCNLMRLHRAAGDRFKCHHYLPQSPNYPETRITNKTCIYDHSGYFYEGMAFAKRYTDVPADERFDVTRLSNITRKEMVEKLVEDNEECPRSCSETSFTFDVSYPVDCTYEDCRYAVAGQLTDSKEILGQMWWRYWNLTYDNDYETAKHGFPCSVVEYEQTEAYGMVFQEYPLHNLSDLASNLGGTLGLWIGASAMSVVQIAYLCCLERLFRKPKLQSVSSQKPLSSVA